MFKQLALAAAIAAAALPSQALTVTQWNFNSVVADANTGTGTLVPNIGAGTAAALGTTGSFASGDASGGSSDPAVGDDSGWGLTGFPTQGTGDKTEGATFSVSTAGYTGILISWDQRTSNTGSANTQFQYSLDGTTFTDFGVFTATAGDVWSNLRLVNLTGVAGVDDNPSFAFRIVSTFAPGTTSYAAATTGSNYATTGTWRFDMVTVEGVAAPVPEAGTLALMFAGLAAVGFIARRRA